MPSLWIALVLLRKTNMCHFEPTPWATSGTYKRAFLRYKTGVTEQRDRCLPASHPLLEPILLACKGEDAVLSPGDRYRQFIHISHLARKPTLCSTSTGRRSTGRTEPPICVRSPSSVASQPATAACHLGYASPPVPVEPVQKVRLRLSPALVNMQMMLQSPPACYHAPF